MQVTQIVWLVLLIVFIVLETATAALVSIWFCAGALAALLVSLFLPGNVWIQGAVFLLVSALSLLALRPMANKLVGKRHVATNADANIGKLCQVVNEIQPGQTGRVKLEGLEWSAKSSSVLTVGSWCRVNSIEGVTLQVEPAPEGPAK